MPSKKNKLSFTRKKLPVIIDPNMPDRSNDPFFVKKAQEAKELIDRVGLPKEFYDSINPEKKDEK